MAELGSKPLKPRRLEKFCTLIAEGKSQADAWMASTSQKITMDSARNGGSRAMRRLPVSQRIAYLRRERATAASEADKSPVPTNPLEIMAMVSTVLKQAYETAKDAGFPAAKLSMIRNGWSLHISRQSIISEKHKPLTTPSTENPILWERIGGCHCHK